MKSKELREVVMKRTLWAAAFGCMLMLAASAALAQARGGRYDQQILSNVARVLAGEPQYANVTVEVEDGIVTLAGSVALDSVRRNLVVKIRHIDHVVGVENELGLSPPAPPDHVLYGEVQRRLLDAGYQDITIQVHEGAVILSGIVRTQKDWHAARQIVSLIPGVKEVAAKLTIATP
jgi:osmotically-inducible protein OsmY